MVARTLTVVQMLPELDSGGVERGTLELGAFLCGRGHRSIVISGGGRLVPQLQGGGSEHVTWPHVGEKSPRCLAYVLPLRRLLGRERVDILHLRSRLPAWVGYLAWKSLPAWRRPRLVTTFHGFYSVNAYSAIMARGERVIAVSNAIAAHIREAYGVTAERIVTIHRGFDAGAFAPDTVSRQRVAHLQTQWGLPAAPVPLVMLAGRLTRLKGHELFFESLAQIADLPWQAVCVGDTRENPSAVERLERRLAALNLGGRVKLVGHCDDMPAAFLLADLVVSPSVEPESFGRTAVEAQAMGKAVIASAHGGSLETLVAGETGWFFPPGDASALAAVLRTALTDPEVRRRCGAAGRLWVARHFSTERMCGRTLGVYRHLLAL